MSKKDKIAIVAAIIMDRMATEKAGTMAISHELASGLAMDAYLRAECLLNYISEAMKPKAAEEKPSAS